MGILAFKEPSSGAYNNTILVSRWAARRALALLFLTMAIDFLDRQILSILIEPIKHQFSLSDTQLGILTGFGFTILYTVTGVPIAALADRKSRKTIIVLSTVVWSAFTAATGFAQSFFHLLIARAGIGVGEAGLQPAAKSILCDYFPPERWSTVMAIYGSGSPIGMLIGMLVGGWVSHFYDWRFAMMVAGPLGFVVALLMQFLMREPPRGYMTSATERKNSAKGVKLVDAVNYVCKRRAIRYIILGQAANGLAIVALFVWVAPLLMRSFGLNIEQAGTWAGLAIGGGGVVGMYSGGIAGDWVSKINQGLKVWSVAVAYAFAALFSLLMLTRHTLEGTLLYFFATFALGMSGQGPGYAMILGLAPVQMRAMASQLSLMLNNLVALGVGPLLVGVLSDAYRASYGVDSLHLALILVPIAQIMGAVLTLMARRTYNSDSLIACQYGS